MDSSQHQSPYLDRQSLFRVTAVLYLIIIVLAVGAYFFNVDGLMDPNGDDRVGRDFVNFWSGGAAVWSGNAGTLYDHAAYDAFIARYFGEFSTIYAFSYPPHVLFLLAPFGLLGYIPALIVWSLGGVAAYFAAARSLFKRNADRAILAFAPATLICLMSGQTGLYAAALFIGGYQLKDKYPLLAGVIFGLLTVKPQLGVLLAIVLLITGNWRAIMTAVATTLALISASANAFGAGLWVDFIGKTMPYQKQILSEDFGGFDHMVPSAYKFIINIGGSDSAAWVAQGAVMVFCIIALLWGYLQGRNARLKLALLCVLTGLFSPYIAVYDMPLYTVGVMLLAGHVMNQKQSGAAWLSHPFLWIVLLLAPYFNIALSPMHIPFGLICMIFVSGLILRALKGEAVALG
ncbi:glycosyltransferase family 87 protein [Fretibacter rubidus]|uniref:glycosyltransferase family 87 protein n=1 Tax=Fretibacter rubidus TaxID=570162 RepID=UPI00352B1E02